MNKSFHALCVELIEAVLSDDSQIACKDVARHARAAQYRWGTPNSAEPRRSLGDEPAVPEGRELAAVTGQPSDEELVKSAQHCSDVYLWSDGSACTPFQDGYDMRGELIAYARAVLARWGNPAPAPPADGEVAELVAWLRRIGPCNDEEAANLRRAAELLEQQALVPVTVSERLPGPEDCDDQGRCWWLVPNRPWPSHYLMMANSGLAADVATHWLPAHALPIPQQQESNNG